MTDYTEEECMRETIRVQDAEIDRLRAELKMALAAIEGHVAQGDELRAQVEALRAEVPEGCTPADARVLRQANHTMAMSDLKTLREMGL